MYQKRFSCPTGTVIKVLFDIISIPYIGYRHNATYVKKELTLYQSLKGPSAGKDIIMYNTYIPNTNNISATSSASPNQDDIDRWGTIAEGMKTEDFQTLWITAQDTPTKEAYVAETGVGRIWCDIDCYDPVPDARKEEELIADEEMPAIQDLIHSEYAIRSMRWIIRHRNDDCVGLRKVDASKIPRYYVDEYTTRRQHHQDVPSRHRFETILGMIPDHEIEQSIERYHEVHNDILLRFYQSRLIFTEQENRLREMGTANLEGVYAIVKDGLSLGNKFSKILQVLL